MRQIIFIDEAKEVSDELFAALFSRIRKAYTQISAGRVKMPEKPSRGKDANPEIYG